MLPRNQDAGYLIYGKAGCPAGEVPLAPGGTILG